MGARSKTRDQSIADTQGAINAASQRLRPLLGPGIQRAVMHLNCASQWLYNGVQLVEVHVKMKLGEYYALQCAHLRELQQQANAAIAKARERIHRDLTKVDVLAEQNIRKVQPIIQNGLLSLAVMDPKLANLLIDVSLWVEGSAEEVHSRLLNEARAGVDGLSHAAHVGVVDLSVAVGTLDANARKVLQGLRISSQQASQPLAVFYPVVLGPLGLAIALAIGGYIYSTRAIRNESTPLERWARRCYFGRANEIPVIHWQASTQQDSAIAELNAATFGLVAEVEFEAKSVDPVMLAKVGRIEALAAKHRLKFRIHLPGFSRLTSGYHWTLIIRRHGDGRAPNFTGGEIIARGELNIPSSSATSTALDSLKLTHSAKHSDYERETILLEANETTPTAQNRWSSEIAITGIINIIGNLATSKIQSATLSIAYWPHHTIAEAYAEIITQVQKP